MSALEVPYLSLAVLSLMVRVVGVVRIGLIFLPCISFSLLLAKFDHLPKPLEFFELLELIVWSIFLHDHFSREFIALSIPLLLLAAICFIVWMARSMLNLILSTARLLIDLLLVFNWFFCAALGSFVDPHQNGLNNCSGLHTQPIFLIKNFTLWFIHRLLYWLFTSLLLWIFIPILWLALLFGFFLHLVFIQHWRARYYWVPSRSASCFKCFLVSSIPLRLITLLRLRWLWWSFSLFRFLSIVSLIAWGLLFFESFL